MKGLLRRALSRLHSRLHALERPARPAFAALGRDSVVSEQALVVNPGHISLGRNCYIHPFVRLEALDHNPHSGEAIGPPRLVMGDRVLVNSFSHIGCIGEVILEDDVGIGSGVTITDHGYEMLDPEVPMKQSPLVYHGPVRLERGAMIGDNVVIVGGVTVGANTFVGANSVVVSDVPAHSVVAGAPARVLRTFDLSTRQWRRPEA